MEIEITHQTNHFAQHEFTLPLYREPAHRDSELLPSSPPDGRIDRAPEMAPASPPPVLAAVENNHVRNGEIVMPVKASSMMPDIQVVWCMIKCMSHRWVGLRKAEDLVRGYSPGSMAVSFVA